MCFLSNKRDSLQTLEEKFFSDPAVEIKKISSEVSFSTPVAIAAEKNQSNSGIEDELSLKKQWELIKERERKLKEKEKALKELEKRIQEKIAYEEKLKREIEELIKKVEVVKKKKIKHLADVYSNMEPQQAAKVLEKLDIKLAVKILSSMRGRKAGEILSYMDPNKAALLSKALTEFQTPFGP